MIRDGYSDPDWASEERCKQGGDDFLCRGCDKRVRYAGRSWCGQLYCDGCGRERERLWLVSRTPLKREVTA